jgi:hypothetical protein
MKISILLRIIITGMPSLTKQVYQTLIQTKTFYPKRISRQSFGNRV